MARGKGWVCLSSTHSQGSHPSSKWVERQSLGEGNVGVGNGASGNSLDGLNRLFKNYKALSSLIVMTFSIAKL